MSHIQATRELLEILPAVVQRHAPDLEEQWRRARQDLRVLLDLPREERRSRVERARSRFRGPFLAELLIKESQRKIPDDPQEAFFLAEFARLVICRSPGTPESSGFLALAIAQIADACRAGDDLPWAEELFAEARSVVASQGVTDPHVVARIDHLEGTFRKVQDRWAEAEKLLSRAALLYEMSGDLVETSHALLGLGGVYFHQGAVDRAIETVQATLEMLPADTEPLLYAYCRHNLIVYLAEAGRYEEAEELLERDEVYDLILKPQMQSRLLWARGKIALLTGKKAEPFLLEAREWFLEEDLGYEAAMVSLDLMSLYLKKGRTGDLQRLTESLVALFEAQAFGHEAMAALLLFRDAARQEQGTVELVEEVMVLLRAGQGRVLAVPPGRR